MKRKNQKRKRYCLIAIIVLLCLSILWIINKNYENAITKQTEKRNPEEKNTTKAKEEKDYDLFVDDAKKETVEKDCIQWMSPLAAWYDRILEESGLTSDKMLKKMQKILSQSGYPVITSQQYGVMKNYKKMELFLQNSLKGIPGSVVMFHLSANGGLSRKEYSFDGDSMYLLTARAGWNDSGEPVVSSISYAKIKEWTYTEKGWFCYELSVLEPPEVSEVVDGAEMIRVTPLLKKYRNLSKKYVFPLGYRGNNLLCSSWNMDTRNTIDYNGLYEYLYPMKYGRPFDSSACTEGIPAEEFEAVITEYLPVTAEELRKWAAYDDETQTYLWSGIGNGNSNSSYFGTAIPEVTDQKENEDGTITLTVDAICKSIVTDGASITHELTIRKTKNGGFQYLGNQILNTDLENIPSYTYRISQNEE